MTRNTGETWASFMTLIFFIALGLASLISEMEFNIRLVLLILIMACVVISGILFRIAQKRKIKAQCLTTLVDCLAEVLDVLFELSRKNYGITLTRNEEEVSITVSCNKSHGQLMIFRGLGDLPDIFALDSSHAYEGEEKDGKLHLKNLEVPGNDVKLYSILKLYTASTLLEILTKHIRTLTVDDEYTITLVLDTVDLLSIIGIGDKAINDLKNMIKKRDTKIRFVMDKESSLTVKMLDPFRPESGLLTIRFHDASDLVVVY